MPNGLVVVGRASTDDRLPVIAEDTSGCHETGQSTRALDIEVGEIDEVVFAPVGTGIDHYHAVVGGDAPQDLPHRRRRCLALWSERAEADRPGQQHEHDPTPAGLQLLQRSYEGDEVVLIDAKRVDPITT